MSITCTGLRKMLGSNQEAPLMTADQEASSKYPLNMSKGNSTTSEMTVNLLVGSPMVSLLGRYQTEFFLAMFPLLSNADIMRKNLFPCAIIFYQISPLKQAGKGKWCLFIALGKGKENRVSKGKNAAFWHELLIWFWFLCFLRILNW